MLNLGLVRSFVGLVEAGSFQQAAARLDIAQPTLSQHLRKLEDQLGVPLIERSHAGSRPTRHGERFLPHARHLLASAAHAEEAARADQLRIGCSGNITSYFMADAMKQFLDQTGWSGRWNITSAPNPQIADMLLSHELDLAAMEWPVSHPDVVTHTWRNVEMCIILPPDHAFADRKTVSVEELLSLQMIGGETGSGTGTLLQEILGEQADQIQIKANVGSTEAVKRAVASGMGASIVLSEAVSDEIENGRLASVHLAGITMRKTLYLAHMRTIGKDDPAETIVRFFSS